MAPIPYGKQQITEADIKAVAEVLRSEFLTQGPKIREFEAAFAEYIGSSYAVAVANGTAALHLSALALDVQPGQKVITTPITFAATANCIRYCGGEVIFCDIDPETYVLDIAQVRKILQEEEDVVGVMPVDFAGYPVNMEAFRELADEHGLWILEDACHAPGGYFIDSKGEKQNCGNGRFSELSIFSFHPVKHIAAGEGGMVTTDDKALYERLQLLRTHGIHKDPDRFVNPQYIAEGEETGKNEGYPSWYMEMQELGFNYRLSDVHAALGASQLDRAPEMLKGRRKIAERYDEAFQDLPEVQQSSFVEGHAYHLYVIEIPKRRQLFDYLRSQGILVQVHYIPCHLMPYYQERGWKKGDFPHAEHYYSRCLSLPIYPTLKKEEQDFVIAEVVKFFEKGS